MLIYIFVCFVMVSFLLHLKTAKPTDLPSSGAGPNEVLGSNSPRQAAHSTIKPLFTMAWTTS